MDLDILNALQHLEEKFRGRRGTTDPFEFVRVVDILSLARTEIETLRKELYESREVNSQRIDELEARLNKIFAPNPRVF